MDIEWEWYRGHLPSGSALSLDVETDYDKSIKKSLRTNNVIQAAISNGTDTVVARGKLMDQMLGNLHYRNMVCGTMIVAHNGWYADIPWIRQTHPTFPWNEGETMVLGYLMDENQKLGLKVLCQKYLGVEDWGEGINAEHESHEFAEYNAKDALFTMQLCTYLEKCLGPRANIADRILLPGMRALDTCSNRGIYLDPRAIAVADDYYGSRLQAVTDRLRDEFGIDNPRQRAIVGERLVEAGHILRKTKSGKYSTDQTTFARLKETPIVSALKEFYSLDKAYGAYVERYKNLSERGDGRSHSQYNIIRVSDDKRDDSTGGTTTGRTSSPDQQLPRIRMLRAFFAAPAGFRFITADYSAIEYRTAAWVAGEQGIIQRYRENPGFDPHTWFAGVLYGKPESQVTPDERQIAKSANFGLLFMASPEALVEYVLKTTRRSLSLVDAKRIYDTWHGTNPMFKQFYICTWEEMLENGYVESVTGRRRHFEYKGQTRVSRFPAWLRARCHRQAVNFLVQGFAADIALIGLAECNRQALPICKFEHDSVSFEVEKGLDIENSITACLVDHPPKYLLEHFRINFDMPLQIEIKCK